MPLWKRLFGSRKSTLRKYILYYGTIALLACALVGVSLFKFSADALNASLVSAEAHKLTLATSDLDAQLETIRNISYAIQTSVYYHPAYLARNRYYERIMVEDLAKYRGYSPIMLDHFLLLADQQEHIFRSDAKTNLALYAASTLGLGPDERQALGRAVAACDAETALALPADGFLLVYPIRFASADGGDSRAWLCAYTQRTALLRRIEVTSGGFESAVDLRLAAGEAQQPPDAGQAGPFRITLTQAQDSGYGELRAFQRLCTRLTVIFTGLLILAALSLAYISYRPIRRLATHYAGTNGVRAGGDELAQLDAILGQAIRQHRLSEKQVGQLLLQIDDQRRSLHDYLLLALLNGDCSQRTLRAMREAGIVLGGPLHAALILRFPEPLPAAEGRKLLAAIESLSAEEARYWAVQLGNQPLYAIVLSASNAEQVRQAPEILQDIAEVLLHALPTVGAGHASRDIDQLPRSLAEAMAACAQGSAAPAAPPGPLHEDLLAPMAPGEAGTLAAPDRRGAQILAFLREHLQDGNLSLEMVADAFNLSGRHVSRLVARETGLGYKDLLMELRIERAKEMLRAEGATVTGVCEALRYASVPYFIKLFRERTGYTPAKYKRLCAEARANGEPA